MKLLIHASEQTNVYADHLRLAQRAFPKAQTIVWKDKPPKLTGEVVLKVGNSYYLGTDQFKALGAALESARTVFTVVNDYTSPPPTQVRDALRGHDVVALTTVPDLAQRTSGRRMWDWFHRTAYVDWNRASWLPTGFLPKPTQEGIIYWGALRPGRVPSFEKYFKDPLYRVSLSGALRSRAAWAELCPQAQWMGRLSLDSCSDWEATIYVEDEKQHGSYHSVASRFYEALGRGLLVFVDRAAAHTFHDAGIKLNDHDVVDSQEAIVAALRYRDQLRKSQKKRLYRDYAQDAVNDLVRAVKENT